MVIREPKPYDTTTLNYNWQLWNCHGFSIYTNATEHILDESAQEGTEAILRFLKKEGILKKSVEIYGNESKHSQILLESEETVVKVRNAGFLLRKKSIGMHVKKGELLAEIIDTYEGNTIEEVRSPKDGVVFYACQKPIVYTNFEIYKII